ncbi:MAG: alpha/beta hydrolase-fold protein [Muribaculaceae bacterium]
MPKVVIFVAEILPIPMKTFCLIALSLLLFSCSDDIPGPEDLEQHAEELICRSETDPQAMAMNDARSEMLPMHFVITRKLGFKYRIYKPAEASVPGEERFPLIIHLHGIDERGNDNIRHLDYIADSLVSYAKRHAAFVVCPQCPVEPYWSLKSRPDSFQPNNMELAPEASYMSTGLTRLIDELVNEHRVDSTMVYIMGKSMGGIGTLDMIVRHRSKFAAAATFSATINSQRFRGKNEVPLMLFHNINDGAIPVEGSRQAFKRLKNLGCEVEYVEGNDGGHDSWSLAFKDTKMLDWLMSHRRIDEDGNQN